MMRENIVLRAVPMRSVGVIAIFCFNDMIEDIIAHKSAGKFSNFSFMFSSQPNAWYSKEWYALSLFITYAWVETNCWWAGGIVQNYMALDKGDTFKASNWKIARGQMSNAHL